MCIMHNQLLKRKEKIMYNYQILTSLNKTDIYEKLLDASINSSSYEIVEDYIYHLRWLFEKLDPEMQTYFFPEKEVKNVQLPENSKL